VDPNLSYDTIYVNSPYWVTNGYWDVKGFQWADPGNSYPSGFNYAWQDGIVSIWVGDWEHDYFGWPFIQGTTVGALRQGSVWDDAAPWYDYPPAHQPSALHFGGKSAITLSARVRIDSGYHTDWPYSWINWLFNPWFRVQSRYLDVVRERKMVWDIVWGYDSSYGYLGQSTAHDWIDENEILHLAFFMSEMAQTGGEWKLYTIDFLSMAADARARAASMGPHELPGWNFEVDDLYMWSIDALVEGFDYNSQFSVDYLKVEYNTGGGGPYCPFVSVWDGTGYVADNNVLPASVTSHGTDVEDYYRLEKTPVKRHRKYSFLLSEFANDHSYIDRVNLIAIDHEADVRIAIAPDGEILTYKNPTPPISAVDNYGNNRLNEINSMNGNVSDPTTYFQGYPNDYLILNFGQVSSPNAKLILRDDQKKATDECILVQFKNSSNEWQTVDVIIPRAYWSTEGVNLSPYVVQGQELLVRLYWQQPHRVDYVGLDTTQPSDYDIHYGNLISAIHSTQGDVKALLAQSDNQYAEILSGQQIELKFTMSINSKPARTFVFYTKGRYETITP
jgi:hypothetical protein